MEDLVDTCWHGSPREITLNTIHAQHCLTLLCPVTVVLMIISLMNKSTSWNVYRWTVHSLWWALGSGLASIRRSSTDTFHGHLKANLFVSTGVGSAWVVTLKGRYINFLNEWISNSDQIGIAVTEVNYNLVFVWNVMLMWWEKMFWIRLSWRAISIIIANLVSYR